MFHSPANPPLSGAKIALPELVAAFSYALDITEGQPAGHCLRACWIGSHIGKALGLGEEARRDLYYALLLKDLGCSSNAARICELYQADDRAFKQGYKTVGTSLAATLYFVFSKTARGAPLHRRASAVGQILKNGDALAQELIVARCTRGAEIARSLRFPESVCEGIYRLDEHWDGSGRPGRLRGTAIPLFSQIALLSQVVEVFYSHAGRAAAIDEARRRAGGWFDPQLVAVLETVSERDDFWAMLASPLVETGVLGFAPASEFQPVDDDYLDSIAAAFGQVIDAKSPYTAGHSRRVAELAGGMAGQLDLDSARQRWLRRAAYLHDIGKLGVSNAILDKPARLEPAEWEQMREHAAHTRSILGRIGAFVDLADVAAAHHERLDGRGYPLGLSAQQIVRDTRVITVCDFYDALTSDRPYRTAMPAEQALEIMRAEVGAAIDGECFEALETTVVADGGSAKPGGDPL